jgi:hypothetical protein
MSGKLRVRQTRAGPLHPYQGTAENRGIPRASSEDRKIKCPYMGGLCKRNCDGRPKPDDYTACVDFNFLTDAPHQMV